MLKYAEIIKAISDKLKQNFPGVIILSDNIEEGITRPSLFISLENIRVKDFMRESKEKSLTVRIHYFPTSRKKNQIELLQVKDVLEDSFLETELIIAGAICNIEEVELEVINNNGRVLHVSFTVKLNEEYNRIDTTELMGDINYKE